MKAFLGLLLCLIAPLASAHALHIFALTDGQHLLGRAYFGENLPAVREEVMLYGEQAELVAKTQTDDTGRFVFELPKRQDYNVIIEGMEGHRAEYHLAAQEIPENAAPNLPADSVELQTLISKAVRQEIQPLREQLDRYALRIYWHDVLGGIGYIFGLAGLVFYFQARRLQGKSKN
ncbi:MAG: hypothetical protein PHP00_13860 [Thiotrichaceae bacterium]|nr:hypothetical protein [Thiotrichaceae bacterium]